MQKKNGAGFLKDVFFNVYSKKQKAPTSLTCKISAIKQALGHFLSIFLKISLEETTVASYIQFH